ncbi:type IV pilus modification protein PilV [Ramlibacter sp. AN1015]|uniref:type IV pilus modification protein PilV n=1 Tax=Ramlibacter sp. AN1015 TaxID=3133428 RepID=UPI0030BEC905
MTTPTPHRRRLRPPGQRGMSLLEVMVALLVLAFGVLGLVALQTRTLKANVSALQRSQASMLSHYILDVMRVDREQARFGAYNTGDDVRCAAGTATGTPTLAESTLRDWINDVKGSIGDRPSTCVWVRCTEYHCSVQIRWDDSASGGLSEQQLTIASRI